MKKKMNIKTKFNFKDKVYLITHRPITKWETCVFCAGEKTIIGRNLEARICPECYGVGGHKQHIKRGWALGEYPLTIGEVQITKRCEYLSDDPDNTFGNYGSQKALYKEQYMCYETGIGSGTLWPGKDLFYSEEKAQKEADKRNKKEEEKDAIS